MRTVESRWSVRIAYAVIATGIALAVGTILFSLSGCRRPTSDKIQTVEARQAEGAD